MAKTTIKNSTLFYHDWLKAFEKMSDADVGKITKALLLLDSQGVTTSFDDDMVLDIVYTQFATTVERNREKYDESCARKSEAAKKREEQKAQLCTTSTTLYNCDDRIREDRIGEDRIREDKIVSGGGKVSEKDVPSAQTPPPTTTTARGNRITDKDVTEVWNALSCSRKIITAEEPQKRWERTEMAVAVSGGKDKFLDVLRSIDEQAYFQKCTDVDYDWLIDPIRWQGILEGKYKKDRNAIPDGWEEAV